MSKQPNSTALRILVVDDESLVRWALQEALGAAGHQVATARDGETTLALLADGARYPDVVLLDYRLPRIDGLELLPRIHALAPASRVILITAYGSPEVRARALALGACRVVDKPIDMDQLDELIA
jgi:DNA-binding NtrC family response regulator